MFGFLNPIVLEGIKGIISGLRLFPDIPPIHNWTNLLQILTEFQKNLMKRLEIIDQNDNFLPFLGEGGRGWVRFFFGPKMKLTYPIARPLWKTLLCTEL